VWGKAYVAVSLVIFEMVLDILPNSRLYLGSIVVSGHEFRIADPGTSANFVMGKMNAHP
jgi:hypothetical protein